MLSDLFKPQKPAEKATPSDVAQSEEGVISLSRSASDAETNPSNGINNPERLLAQLDEIEEDIKKELNAGVAVDIYNNSVIMHNAIEAAKDVAYELIP